MAGLLINLSCSPEITKGYHPAARLNASLKWGATSSVVSKLAPLRQEDVGIIEPGKVEHEASRIVSTYQLAGKLWMLENRICDPFEWLLRDSLVPGIDTAYRQVLYTGINHLQWQSQAQQSCGFRV